MLNTQTQAAAATPIINFAAQGHTALAGGENLTSLIAAFSAAEKAYIAADDAEDEAKAAAPKVTAPRVFGGVNPAMTMVRDWQADIEIPAMDWFYTSRESIERDAPADKRAALLADWDSQQAAIDKAVPKAVRAAKRKRNEAARDFNRAERAIINLKPANLAEAAALLEYTSRDGRFAAFTADESDLRKIMRNVAAAIQSAA